MREIYITVIICLLIIFYERKTQKQKILCNIIRYIKPTWMRDCTYKRKFIHSSRLTVIITLIIENDYTYSLIEEYEGDIYYNYYISPRNFL